MSDEDSRLVLRRLISTARAGPELDKLVGLVIFGMKSEACAEHPDTYHLIGSGHYSSRVDDERMCASPLPSFSTDWEHFKIVVEWLTSNFSGTEMIWDCNKWGCNVNGADGDGRWFRLSSSSGAASLQEAVCKAALICVVNPQALPLEFRSRVVDKPVVRKVRKGRKK